MKVQAGTLRTFVPLAVIAAALVGAACSKKEEPAPQQAAGATSPSAAQGSGDWSWADSPSSPAPAPAAAPAPPVMEEPAPRPIEQPRSTTPAPSRPSRTTPKPSQQEPTNKLSHAPAPEPAREPEPVKVSYVAHAGTQATFHLDDELSSDTASVGDPVRATLAADIVSAEGRVVLPAGTKLTGSVTQAVAARKTKKKSFLAYSLTSAELPDGSPVAINLGEQLEGKGWTKKDGAIIGGSAAGGAILGQVLGHDTKSTAAGAIVGGAIGSGIAMSKKGEDVVLPAGSDHSLPLGTDLTVVRLEPAHRVSDTD